MPLMHKNLAQIARTWIGGQLLQPEFDEAAILPFLGTSHPFHLTCTDATSSPADLIQWLPINHLPRSTTLQTSSSTTEKFTKIDNQQRCNPQQTVVSVVNNKSTLNPLAPIFFPRASTSLQSIGRSTAPIVHKVQEQKKRSAATSTLKQGPSKRTSFLLPGQSLLSKYLSKKTAPFTDPQSLSIITTGGDENSRCEDLTSTPTQQLINSEVGRVEPSKPVNSQKTLFDFSYFKPYASISPQDPDIFGHLPQEIDTSRTLRIVLQNPNGIRPSVTEPDFMFSLHLCHQIGVSAICLAETNLNWNHSQHSTALRRCLHRNWSSSKFQFSIPEEKFIGNYQPGGTLTIVTDRWTSKVITTGSDPYGLGRWSYIILKGKADVHICIITAYLVCDDKSTGPKTAYQQQKRHLAAIFRQQNVIATADPFK